MKNDYVITRIWSVNLMPPTLIDYNLQFVIYVLIFSANEFTRETTIHNGKKSMSF